MYDVAIVGAGPVGLFLACELAANGRTVLVVEREDEPTSEWKQFPLGMRGLNAGTIEAFYRRGLLPALLEKLGADAGRVGAPDDGSVAPRDISHFAGIGLDAAKVHPSAVAYRLPGPAMEGIMGSLDAVDSVLLQRATEFGVAFVRGAAVDAVTQDEQSVTVRAGQDEYTARWVVGCDGGRSVVRAVAGFEFVGTPPLFTGYVARVTFDDPDKLALGFNLTPTGMYLRTPFEGHLGMMDFDGGSFDRSQPLTAEHLQDVIQRVSGTDVAITHVHLASSFTDRAMQTTSYRNGRVLVAGDAAHIHSPLGGQGLNLGIGDAMNLGWKLAAVIAGNAPETLLETYTAERHPVGQAILEWSRAQVATMNPGPNSPALHKLVHDVLDTPDGTTHVFEHTSGLAHRYNLGTDEEPLVGRTAPDFHLTDGTRLGDLLHDGTGVMLDFTPDAHWHDTAAPWDQVLHYVNADVNNSLGLEAVLIRPDGIVAWTADVTTPAQADATALTQACERWFGLPAAPSAN